MAKFLSLREVRTIDGVLMHPGSKFLVDGRPGVFSMQYALPGWLIGAGPSPAARLAGWTIWYQSFRLGGPRILAVCEDDDFPEPGSDG